MPVGRDAEPGQALTEMEYKVIELAAEGYNQTETGIRLGYAYQTIKWYWTGIKIKLEARSVAHAVALAYEEGAFSKRMVVKRFLLEIQSDTSYRSAEQMEEDQHSIELALENAKDTANDILAEGLSCKIRDFT